MSEQTLFEKLGVRYREKDGILYPLISVEIKEENVDIGKYGRLWMKYIQSEYPQSDIVNITLHFFLKDVRSMQHSVMNHSTAVA